MSQSVMAWVFLSVVAAAVKLLFLMVSDLVWKSELFVSEQ